MRILEGEFDSIRTCDGTGEKRVGDRGKIGTGHGNGRNVIRMAGTGAEGRWKTI